MTAADIIALVRRRDVLAADLADIDAQLERLASLATGAAPKATPAPAVAASTVDAGRRPRTCHKCGVVGHDVRKCPDVTGKPLVREEPGRERPASLLDIKQYDALVRSIANKIKHGSPSVDIDELIGWGMIGLLEAWARFDSGRGNKFATFAYWRVRGAMIDGLRSSGAWSRADMERFRADESKGIRLVGMEAAINTADESVPQSDAAIDTRANAERVRAAVAELPTKERRLIEMYYFGHKTLEEAGAALGLSKSWACRIHARAVEIMRPALEAAA